MSDNTDGLPAYWSESARNTYAEITGANPALDAVALAVLFEGCALLAQADAAQEAVTRDGMTISGSTGQIAAHPLLSEIRACRLGAMTHLRALGIAPGQSSASAAGAALAAKRHHGKTPGRRAGGTTLSVVGS